MPRTYSGSPRSFMLTRDLINRAKSSNTDCVCYDSIILQSNPRIPLWVFEPILGRTSKDHSFIQCIDAFLGNTYESIPLSKIWGCCIHILTFFEFSVEEFWRHILFFPWPIPQNHDGNGHAELPTGANVPIQSIMYLCEYQQAFTLLL